MLVQIFNWAIDDKKLQYTVFISMLAREVWFFKKINYNSNKMGDIEVCIVSG